MTPVFILFAIPFVLALLIATAPPLSAHRLKVFAFGLSLVPLIYFGMQYSQLLGSEVHIPWFPSLGVNFHLAIDPLSLLFIGLVLLIIPVSIASVVSEEIEHSHTFYFLIFMLEGLLIGLFASRDLAFFTLFWEATLIPLYFIIAQWGSHHPQKTALKFLVYMIAGSALMVAAVLGLYFAGGKTFDMEALQRIAENAPYAKWLFAIFLLAFAVKTPLFPFHAWLPDTYTHAPTPGTILLSALLSKAGIYGLLRIAMPFFPNFMQAATPYLLPLAIAGVLYGSFAAWMQKDYKRLIAYSSFAHVNFILAALFAWGALATTGGIFQAINHGITIAALFLAAGWLEQRIGTTALGPVHGLAQFMPHLAWITLVFVLSSVALPGTNSFVGELLILVGIFKNNPWAAAILSISIILAVIYMLRWMQKVFFEKPGFYQEKWRDLHLKEFAIALPLIAMIFWLGIYPAPVLKQAEAAAREIEGKS